MSNAAIRKALEDRLFAMTGTPAKANTEFENVTFTPIAGTPHQKVYLMPAQPADEQAGALYFKQGIFQVSLCFPANAGPNAAEARAAEVELWFKRGTTLTASGVTVFIKHPPKTAQGFIDGDRWVVPVSIAYQAQINAS